MLFYVLNAEKGFDGSVEQACLSRVEVNDIGSLGLSRTRLQLRLRT